MVNVVGLVVIILIVLVVVYALSIALPQYIKFTQSVIVDDIDKAHETMCGIPDKLSIIFDTIDTISHDNLDDRAKGIYQQMIWKNDVKSCDIIYFYKQLDSEQKKKLNWLELSCNVRQCLD